MTQTLRDFSQLDPTAFAGRPDPLEPTNFIRKGLVAITADQAERLLDVCKYDRQRPIDRNQVRVLAFLMEHGYWQPQMSHMYFARLGDELHMFNGQHRLRAQLVNRATATHNIELFHPKNLHELRELYMVPDTNQK